MLWKIPPIVFLPVIFCASTAYLYMLSVILVSLDGPTTDRASLSFPHNLEELQSLAAELLRYKNMHLTYILVFFCSAYVYKQTFAIPGSVFLNLLAGALFGVSLGFPLTCLLTAIGATNCYWLSHFFGKKYIVKYFPGRLKNMQDKVKDNKDGLFFFLLFLRLFPMSPNWFLNMAAPILNIPVHLFFLSVFIGLMPYNYMCVETGCLLSQLTNIDDIFSIGNIVKLATVAFVAIVPGLLLRKYRTSRSGNDTNKDKMT